MFCKRNKHVLSACSSAIALDRYTVRHNSVLAILVTSLKNELRNKQCTIYADLDGVGLPCTSAVFNDLRPDVAVIINKTVVVLV